jgi:hypothetical protein
VLLVVVLVVACIVAVPSGQTTRDVATVTANAPIYIGAAFSQTPLRVAAPGTVLKVRQQQGDWIEVEFSDTRWGARVGWVQQAMLTFNTGTPPMDLAPPSSAPLRPCLILKNASPNHSSPLAYVEGNLPDGLTFYSKIRISDPKFFTWRQEVTKRGGNLVILRAHADAVDRQDARDACKLLQQKRR